MSDFFVINCVRWSKSTQFLSLRGTVFFVLGLCGVTEKGEENLLRSNW